MTVVGNFLGRFALTRYFVDLIYGYHGPDISRTVDGIYYKTPFLLSAGFDYNGHLSRILPCIGLAGEEIGSVTAKPCEGNPKPRLTRMPKSKGIIVNKGLRNDGVEVIIKRLAEIPKTKFVKGVSIAKTNCLDSATIEGAIEDYVYSFKRLSGENVGDYYTLNISCPNAYGGEAFIKADLLKKAGFQIGAIQSKGNSLIHQAIYFNSISLLKLLEAYNIPIDYMNEDGMTALHLAAMKASDDSLLKYLIERGASVTIKTSMGESVMDLAKENEVLSKKKVSLAFLN